MDQQHPITPSPKLVQDWICEEDGLYAMCAQAARWGADQELEACCEWVERQIGTAEWGAELRRLRRPKPPSLAEQALTKIDAILSDPRKSTLKDELEALELSRRALKRLQELESNG